MTKIQINQAQEALQLLFKEMAMRKGTPLHPSNPDEFSTHQIIEKYAYLYEVDYIDWLSADKGNKAFQNVHKEIGKFLERNADALGIRKTECKENINVFGHDTPVQFWTRIK